MTRLLSLVFMAVLVMWISMTAFAGSITIGSPQITWLTFDEVNRVCSAKRPLNACTTIRGTINCGCFQSGNVWRRTVDVSATAVMYLSDAGHLTHEMHHVADFRSLLRDYVKNAEARTFATAAECEAASGRLRAGFDDELIAVRNESARRRDGMSLADAARTVRSGLSTVTIREEPAELANDPSTSGAEAAVRDAALQPFLTGPA